MDRCRTFALTLLALAPVASGCAKATTHEGVRATTPSHDDAKAIAPVLATLAKEVESRSPGTELAIAVYDFSTHVYAGVADETPHVSASSAKAIWVAAALKRVGVGPVMPHAKPIFESSSNDDATEVIKMAGPDQLNEFYGSARMTRSGFTQWFGQTASNSPHLLGTDNYFTAKDAVSFMVGVHDGTLLDPPSNATLQEWLTWTPRTGFGGWLGTLLPEEVRSTLVHKAGWLPPPYDERAVNEIGIVKIPGGHTYAVAILARHGADYQAEQAFVEHASCSVFRAVSTATLDCK